MAVSDSAILCAAIVYDDGTNANSVLEDFASALRAQGVRVKGLIQRRAAAHRPCAGDVMLLDLDGGDYRISQNLGEHSTCCSLDSAGLAEASQTLRRALDDPPDLLVVNKFGKAEAHGEGLRAELGEALAAGIPVVTTVHRKNLDYWRDFVGELACLLPAETDSLMKWWNVPAP
ncbi:MAG: DUF2478 domain-containing protein [Magnetospirillum sp.]